jgi:putative ABC transport system permease protein
MLKNYLVIACRSLLKNKLFSLINIIGMAISMASVLAIAIYVYDEVQFDRHVENVALKYRVYNEIYYDDGRIREAANIPPMIAPTMHTELPEVDTFARYQQIYSPILFQNESIRFTEKNGGYADPYLLKMLSVPIVESSSPSPLSEPYAVVITKALAEKYFANARAVGKQIAIMGEAYNVTAVIAKFNDRSHLQADYLLSMATLETEASGLMKSWGWMQFHTYVKLKDDVSVKSVEGKMKRLAEQHAWPVTKPGGSHYVPRLMPLVDIHLRAGSHQWDSAIKGNEQTVYIFLAAGCFILFISSLNFINLSTARAAHRMKEIGVRKIAGAVRHQLMLQFIAESTVIAAISFFLGGFLVELSLPLLNDITNKNFPSTLFLEPLTMLVMMAAVLLIGIAAGLYPAFYLSALKPKRTLVGKGSSGHSRDYFRMSLVVIQFMLSFILIVGTMVVRDQLHFLRNGDAGFSADNVIIMELRGKLRGSHDGVRTSLATHPNVTNVSLQYGLPGEIYPGDIFIDRITNKQVQTSMLLVDHDYVKTLDLKLVAGRDLSKDFPSDEADAFLITEAAAKLFGFQKPSEAIGHPIAWQPWAADSLKNGKVVGVIRDFHLNSLRDQVAPVVLHIYPRYFSTIAVRVKSTDLPSTLAHLQTVWKTFEGEWPFDYRFLDSNFERMYKSEERLSVLFGYFSILAVFVACLGLFGLVTYSTSQRFKEIGIRKVLGAENKSLLFLLTKSYLALIVIAFVLASPLSYYVVNEWLSGFAYHIDVTWMLFVNAGMIVLGIALVTVIVQSLKAVTLNPVNVLKE